MNRRQAPPGNSLSAGCRTGVRRRLASERANALVVLLLVLAALGAALWAIFMAAGFALVWGPPAIAALLFWLMPPVQAGIAAAVFKRHGLGPWTATRSGIRAALGQTGFSWLVAGGSTLLLVGWIALNGYERLSLGRAFGEATLEKFFTADTDDAVFARVCFTVLPWGLALWCVEKIASAAAVDRIDRVARRLAGVDEAAAALERLDDEMGERIGQLGVAARGTHANEYRRWLGEHAREIAAGARATESELHSRLAAAQSELNEVEACATAFEEARCAYHNGLARLRQASSVALLGALEDAGRALVSEPFTQLVQQQRWGDVRSFLDEVGAELTRVDGLTDEWARSQGESMDVAGMTVERALTLLALPRDCTRDDIERRRRELAKIYHPDRAATDTELQSRNTRAFQEINAACDILAAARS